MFQSLVNASENVKLLKGKKIQKIVIIDFVAAFHVNFTVNFN